MSHTYKASVLPRSQKSKDGAVTYNTVDIIEPVSYNVEFSHLGGKNPKHLKAMFEKCAEDFEEVEIEFSMKTTKFGSSYVIQDIKSSKTPIK